MLEMMARVPEMSDLIVNVFTARRLAIFKTEVGALTLIGASEDPELQRVATFASRNRFAIHHVDLGTKEARELFDAAGIETERPVAMVGRDRVLELVFSLQGLEVGASVIDQ